MARTLLGIFACLVLTPRGPAQASWLGPWSWSSQLTTGSCTGYPTEFAHAALIPTGPHAGKVLLWRLQVDPASCQPLFTTESWLFDPGNPTKLIRIDFPALQSSLFCSGASWRKTGELLVVGGVNFNVQWPQETYLFIPQNLGRIKYDANNNPYIHVNPNTPVWVRLGDTRIPHYYGTVIPLNRDAINYSASATQPQCGTIEGGSNLIGSGPPQFYVEGNEFWEPMGSTATAWGCPLYNLPSTTLHQFYDLPPKDAYSLHPAPPSTSAPDPRLDSYARMFQLSTSEILICGDVDTVSPTIPQYYGCHRPGIDPNGAWARPGAWWVMKLRYGTALPDWQLHQGPNSPTMTDQFYDSAVLLHTLADGPDRVFRFGGSSPPTNQHSNPVGAWSVNDQVEVFQKNSAPGADPIVHGRWVNVPLSPPTAAFKRVFGGAVITPTGDIVYINGSSVDSYGGHGGGSYQYGPPPDPCSGGTLVVNPDLPETPVDKPVIFTPGHTNPQTPPSYAIMPSNPNPTPAGLPTPRLYHSLALLLLDGTVWIAGGEKITTAAGYPSPYEFPQYSGEIFRPQYCNLPFQPSIKNAPSINAVHLAGPVRGGRRLRG